MDAAGVTRATGVTSQTEAHAKSVRFSPSPSYLLGVLPSFFFVPLVMHESYIVRDLALL